MEQQNRQLAAILFTDIVGYTAMMQKDEETALAVTRHFITALKQSAETFHGRILNDYGDGSLCCFPTATEAVKAAAQIQQQLQQEPKVPLRIGIHVGELFFEENKVMGDSVNVASRIQSLACANSILFSKEVFDKLKNQPECKSVSLGKFEFKNVDEPLEIFALANEGLVIPKREQLRGKLKEINKKSFRKKLVLVAVVLFLLAAAFFLYKQFFNRTGFQGKEKSIAILPFTIIGTNADNMSEGLVEDILVHLSKIRELNKVISNRSSSKYADSKKSPSEIGEELKVNSLVMGSIQQIGDTIRVSAQLIDSRSGNMLWADNYTREKKQIFDLETELATKIVNALQAKLTSQEEKGLSKRYTENVEAYKFYRKGRAFWNAEGKVNFDSAEANYKRAIQQDPDYALAYAGLADCYSLNYLAGMLPLERVPIAKMYAAKALSLDSTLSEALTATGYIQQSFDYEWVKSKRNLEKAIDLDPNNAIAHMNYGLVLMYSTPDKEGALRELKNAVDLDPLSFRTNLVLARNYYFAGKYDLAMAQFKKVTALSDSNQKGFTIYLTGLTYLKKHLFPLAKEAFDQLPEGLGRCYGYAAMGDKTKAIMWLEKASKKEANNHYTLSQVYVALGNFDEAMNQLEVAYENRLILMFWIKVDPAFDPIRNEPRFKKLIKKMNLE
jgi:adenylate cyclase